mgnify:CR=1 FL=1|jgi:hypothetical protein
MEARPGEGRVQHIVIFESAKVQQIFDIYKQIQ